jgi:hypothetical protein
LVLFKEEIKMDNHAKETLTDLFRSEEEKEMVEYILDVTIFAKSSKGRLVPAILHGFESETPMGQLAIAYELEKANQRINSLMLRIEILEDTIDE